MKPRNAGSAKLVMEPDDWAVGIRRYSCEPHEKWDVGFPVMPAASESMCVGCMEGPTPYTSAYWILLVESRKEALRWRKELERLGFQEWLISITGPLSNPSVGTITFMACGWCEPKLAPFLAYIRPLRHAVTAEKKLMNS